MRGDETESGTWVEVDADETHISHVREIRLSVLDGPDAGLTETFGKDTVVIGRRGGDLALEDRRVSALHAELRLGPGGYRLRDLGSSNGTFVMGLRVIEAFVHPGAVLGVGESTLRFEPLQTSVGRPLSARTQLGSMSGASVPMRRLFREIEKTAPTDMAALVTGETGTGKELVAEAIHELSDRADGPFVVVDCASIPRNLFASELFGHEAGAFTGAGARRIGALERANGGTLFLDELGEVPLELQPNLLRALEARSFRRLGGADTIESDFRIVSATNRDLRALVNQRAFRDDLYFRVAVVTLEAPPLRDRGADVELLARRFAAEYSDAELPEGFLAWARAHAWPGNVRELRNGVERAILGLSPGEVARREPSLEVDLSTPLREAKQRLVDAFERRYLSALLDAHGWAIAPAARAARVDRMTIYKSMARLGLERPSE